MRQLRFDGQVAIVTGAGRGIGAAHAALLASRGARVMVNDVGASMRGSGEDTEPAASTVERIVARGGVAETDGSDVSTPEGAQALVDHTVERFGRLDIVVNNAGIGRRPRPGPALGTGRGRSTASRSTSSRRWR
jgi:NAD(P)-dependent dehydrogenase (short-subunit alcohol dehydrogenase family)